MGGDTVITYEPFWDKLRYDEISTYSLIHDYGISSNTINRLRHDLPIDTNTIDKLCDALGCGTDDIIRHVDYITQKVFLEMREEERAKKRKPK